MNWNRFKRWAAGACLLGLQILLPSCSSSKGSSASGALSGNWQISLQGPSTTYTQSGFVLQTGNVLSGQLLLNGTCAGVGAALGSTKGAAVTLTVNQAAQTIALTGNAGSDGSTISGDYSILTAGCGSTEVGTWTATRIKTLTGSFSGAFTSNVGGVAPFSFSGSVTQGPNQGTSQATMDGSMTSTDATCFTTASISGVISGRAVVLNLATADGVSLGQFKGTTTADATTVTGSYDFFNAQTPIPGCPGGDFGSATLTVQPQ